MNREDQFLAEYEVLCRKYQMIISACGCCSSPYLVDVQKDIDRITSHSTDPKYGLEWVKQNLEHVETVDKHMEHLKS